MGHRLASPDDPTQVCAFGVEVVGFEGFRMRGLRCLEIKVQGSEFRVEGV